MELLQFDELLLEIFDYLRAKDLFAAALVCRKWNEVISSSERIMEKLLLRIMTPWDDDDTSEVMSLKRRFHSMKFDFDGGCDDELIAELAQKHGARVKMLFFRYVTIKNTHNFRETLKCFPLLEHLEIFEMHFQCNDQSSADPKVALKKLKLLRIRNSSPLIKEQIRNESISLENIVTLWSIEQGFIHNFLAIPHLLTKLIINYQDIPRICALHLSRDFPFKLKSLQVTGIHRDQILFDGEVFINFSKFLISQKDSITDVDVYGIKGMEYSGLQPSCFKIFEVIFNELPHLESLKLDLCSFLYLSDTHSKLVHRLRSNMKLKRLDCGKAPVSRILAIELLSKFPGLETLSICRPDGDLLPFLAMNNSKLKSLTLQKVSNPASPTLKFEFLENVVFFRPGEFGLWLPFVMNNSSIRSLEIKFRLENINDENVNTLKTHPNLIFFNNKELVK